MRRATLRRASSRSSRSFRFWSISKKEYTYKLYMQEPHGWYHWRPVNVEDSLRRLGDFFDHKVLGMEKGATQDKNRPA